LARQNEYSGEQCGQGHPLYVRVVKIGARPENRRGPSCWFDDCPEHQHWQRAH
jgi:hypothetical protein